MHWTKIFLKHGKNKAIALFAIVMSHSMLNVDEQFKHCFWIFLNGYAHEYKRKIINKSVFVEFFYWCMSMHGIIGSDQTFTPTLYVRLMMDQTQLFWKAMKLIEMY